MPAKKTVKPTASSTPPPPPSTDEAAPPRAAAPRPQPTLAGPYVSKPIQPAALFEVVDRVLDTIGKRRLQLGPSS